MTKDNEIDSTSQLNRSGQKPSQPDEHIWSVKDLATKEEIITKLQFGAQNIPFSYAKNIAVCSQEQLPDVCGLFGL